MKNRPTKPCEECGSLYFGDSSRMMDMCPECSHLIYGYEPCVHVFVGKHCQKCYWDGSVSPYCQSLKKASDAS